MAWWIPKYMDLFLLRKQPGDRHIFLIGFHDFMKFPTSVLDKSIDWEGAHRKDRPYGYSQDQRGMPEKK